jgi:hypothetical protein
MEAKSRKRILGTTLVVASLVAASSSQAADRIFRCESEGKVTFSDRGCAESDGQTEVQPGRLNSFDTEPASKKPAAARVSDVPNRKPRDSSIALEQQRAQQKCQRLADRLTAIEVKMRRGYSIEEGERLREQRRQIEQQRRTERC